MTLLAVAAKAVDDCWNRIGVWGDRSCPQLAEFVHCHNCPVFAAAGRSFLDAPSPAGYLEEWTERLAPPTETAATDLQSVLIFRIGAEWLALPIGVLLEVTTPRAVHRVPHRAGLLAGLVNIRGELHLCVRMAELLGIKAASAQRSSAQAGQAQDESHAPEQALIVVGNDGERWVFPVDEVDQMWRLSIAELTRAPATLARSAARLTRGVFDWRGRSVGYLDDARLFQALRTKTL